MTSTRMNGDTKAVTSTCPSPTIPSCSLDITLSDSYNTLYQESRWDETSKSWSYTDAAKDIPAEPVQSIGAHTMNSDSWKEYCFVFVQKHSKPSEDSDSKFLPSPYPPTPAITFEIFLINSHLVKACQDVMGDIRGVSWNSQPIKLDPKMLISYFPLLEKQGERNFKSPTYLTEEDGDGLKPLRTLLAHMRKHYKETLERVAMLVKNREITFDLLYAILPPGTVIIQCCPVTREFRALKLLTAHERIDCRTRERYWSLRCEYLEFTMGEEDSPQDIGRGDPMRQAPRFGMREEEVKIIKFDGVARINSLSAYPLEFHSDPALKTKLLQRAHTWVSLCGVHHVRYKGAAGRHEWVPNLDEHKLRRYNIDSRIIVDKANFTRMGTDYFYEVPEAGSMPPTRSNSDNGLYGLGDAELLLAPAVVYGFSLTDKLWLEFNVTNITPIEWNKEAFDGLVLPPERKAVLRGLVEAHSLSNVDEPKGFDDFVRGKGQGLVVNLFGPPGVGKTLSAEATSEYVKRPLYILGSGDLGTTVAELDKALREAFDLAAAWRAVLLIDEADVFLEQRSLHDLERNAKVAGFLRHLEYYHGILFMTTNRVQAFDEAFLSRIHVALYFDPLSESAKVEIWRAFLRKAGWEDAELEEDGLLLKLAKHDLNGRQIKNACKTAASLAASRRAKMEHKDLEQVMKVMEDFTRDFKREQITH